MGNLRGNGRLCCFVAPPNLASGPAGGLCAGDPRLAAREMAAFHESRLSASYAALKNNAASGGSVSFSEKGRP